MRIGVLGGGQLGRMLALAARPLGLEVRFFEPGAGEAIRDLGERVSAAYDDRSQLDAFCKGLDVVTYEFENVPVAAARHLAEMVPVRPGWRALEVAQDRWSEKEFFRTLGVRTAPYLTVDSREELAAAGQALGYPFLLKTRRLGYDGKGQARLNSPTDLDVAWGRLGGVPLLAEAFVPFDRELSIVTTRSLAGEFASYPLVENHHLDGILRETIAPAPNCTAELEGVAQRYAASVMDALEYVGVLGLELFQSGSELLANEFAPRVHNSGHWTQDGALTDQFENHVRAICGLPLGSTAPTRERTVMLNLIGRVPPLADLLGVPELQAHLYGKSPRPGRKVGHVNVTGGERAVERGVARVRELMRLTEETELASPGLEVEQATR